MVNVLPIAGYLAWQPVIPVLPFLALMALAAAALALTVRHVRDAAGRRAAALTGTVRGCVFALVLAALAQPMIHRRGGADGADGPRAGRRLGVDGRALRRRRNAPRTRAADAGGGPRRAARNLALGSAAVHGPHGCGRDQCRGADARGGRRTRPTDIPAALAGRWRGARRVARRRSCFSATAATRGRRAPRPGAVHWVAAGVGDATRPSRRSRRDALAAPEAVERETAFRVTARIEARGGVPFLRQAAALAARLLRQEAGGSFAEVARAAVDASSAQATSPSKPVATRRDRRCSASRSRRRSASRWR